ncbi:uncharacterized protein LOC114527885 isoform X2 [Dendronephthya gigantea]|nr:uncharacterized protein LOC114527885 isoform X2 [Dendronephthya gigantea]
MMCQRFCVVIVLLFLPVIESKMRKVLKVRNYHDPGTCAKSNHGELILVKDRENKDTIVVCTEDAGIYSWKTTEGSRPPGEYFNPGYDCLDILTRNRKAKDGYYWVDFHRSVPYKVWCDMTTDGGGYILIGWMNNSVTWNVPSSNDTVGPFDEPHWSSVFGDIPILDFRVQVAADVDYTQTVAHWSFRFKNKRQLSNLMMVNEGGCPYNLPGIGDISYVKDLITEEISSKDFSCSVFGVYSHPSAKIGWSMMNSCLQKPCPHGFAYHPLFPVQVDFSGGFSFLAANQSETISDGTTAFFGCDKGKCCACYGPVGRNGVYCGRECKAKNGGTVVKDAHAWFWIRLNPPQKVWEKCMEYRTEEENGDAAWYKLIGDRETPVKGRCGKNKAILNDGIVVVPDDVTQDRIPHITGLLAYQKDSQVLRLRKKDAWKNVAEEEMVLRINNETLTRLELMVNLLHSRDILASTILRNEPPEFLERLKQWIPFNTLTRCYRASEDGWLSNVFHLQCGGIGKTVTLVKVQNYIFGGYSDQSWGIIGSSASYISSSNSFVFSFRNKDNLSPFKANVYQNNGNAIYTNIGYGPTFGGGHDFYIATNAKSSTSSYSNFGHTYLPPSGYSYASGNTRALLAGSYRFRPSEVEVYYFY